MADIIYMVRLPKHSIQTPGLGPFKARNDPNGPPKPLVQTVDPSFCEPGFEPPPKKEPTGAVNPETTQRSFALRASNLADLGVPRNPVLHDLHGPLQLAGLVPPPGSQCEKGACTKEHVLAYSHDQGMAQSNKQRGAPVNLWGLNLTVQSWVKQSLWWGNLQENHFLMTPIKGRVWARHWKCQRCSLVPRQRVVLLFLHLVLVKVGGVPFKPT